MSHDTRRRVPYTNGAHQVADGVWGRQSSWVWSNAIVVRGDDGLVLVDPGIDGSDLVNRPNWLGAIDIGPERDDA